MKFGVGDRVIVVFRGCNDKHDVRHMPGIIRTTHFGSSPPSYGVEFNHRPGALVPAWYQINESEMELDVLGELARASE